MKLPEKSKAMQLLEKYCEAYKSRDISAVLALFCQDCYLWGTAKDEHRVGIKALEEQHRRDWSQSESGEIKIVTVVPTSQDASWAAAICKGLITIDGVEHVFENLRGTVTIKKENGDWKISHMHASFPCVNTELGNSFPSR